MYLGKGKQKHWVLRREHAASHGISNSVIQDDAIYLQWKGDFCVSGPWWGTLRNVPGGSGWPEVLVCKGLHEKMIEQTNIACPTKTELSCMLLCNAICCGGHLSTTSVFFSLMGLEPSWRQVCLPCCKKWLWNYSADLKLIRPHWCCNRPPLLASQQEVCPGSPNESWVASKQDLKSLFFLDNSGICQEPVVCASVFAARASTKTSKRQLKMSRIWGF